VVKSRYPKATKAEALMLQKGGDAFDTWITTLLLKWVTMTLGEVLIPAINLA